MKTAKTCNQCEALYINGVFCHETGCSNQHKHFIDGEWVNFVKCSICGYELPEDEICSCYLDNEPDDE